MQSYSEIVKLAHTLSGKERARLVLKDQHYKSFIDKKGFLSEREATQLRTTNDFSVREEYNFYASIYASTPLVMTAVSESYLKFMIHYEALRRGHLLLSFVPALDSLRSLIEESVPKDKRAEALKLLEALSPLEAFSKGLRKGFKETLDKVNRINRARGKTVLNPLHAKHIERHAGEAFRTASAFYSMKKIVDDMTEALGFSPFLGRNFEKTYDLYIDEMGAKIKEHNEIITEAGKDLKLEKIKNLLIETPTTYTDLYVDWYKRLFKEKPTGADHD